MSTTKTPSTANTETFEDISSDKRRDEIRRLRRLLRQSSDRPKEERRALRAELKLLERAQREANVDIRSKAAAQRRALQLRQTYNLLAAATDPDVKSSLRRHLQDLKREQRLLAPPAMKGKGTPRRKPYNPSGPAAAARNPKRQAKP